ncbi:hypothetical protein A6U98_02055 [Rhizobium sp. WYCCWR10014]|nr:hypothetical protein A6U98_02055 [Rhizobium sp. WYCCWR10014]
MLDPTVNSDVVEVELSSAKVDDDELEATRQSNGVLSGCSTLRHDGRGFRDIPSFSSMFMTGSRLHRQPR